ncbi:MAG: hypothetical protein D6816_18425 [Bacteroidetes bacterium]|nr:MAG: hypothetical protein D6816_18425 [Bacteroidota bacterium]
MEKKFNILAHPGKCQASGFSGKGSGKGFRAAWLPGIVSLLLLSVLLTGCLGSGDSVGDTRSSEVDISEAVTEQPDDEPDSASTPIPTETEVPEEAPLPAPQVEISVRTANIRSGPGTDFGIVSAGHENDIFDVAAKNDDGSWYLISQDGHVVGWISDTVVNVVDSDSMNMVEVAATVPAPPVLPASQPDSTAATQPPAVQPAATTEAAPQPGQVVIVGVNKRDEYVDIKNVGGSPVDLSGWVLVSEKGNQACGLGTTIQPGAVLRVWALAEDSSQGGYNCGFDSPIWNNSKSDPAVLYDANGVEVSRW